MFIIPKVLSELSSKFLLTAIVLVFGAETLKAQPYYGCHVVAGSQQRVYLNAYGPAGGAPSHWIAGGSGGFVIQNAGECIDDLGPPCKVYKPGTTSSTPTPAEEMYSVGTYSYFYVNCPIDNYLPLILISIASIGFLQIRKIPIFNGVNENIDHHRSL